jgi:hypothetical protein
MRINNLAVCFYGQWRTGDVCVPYIKSMIDQIEDLENVDYFCSIKNCTSFHAGFRLKERGHHAFSENEIDSIKKKLQDILSPKYINVIYDDPNLDFNVPSNDGNFNLHGALSPIGVIDSIILKQNYEATTGINYDAVLLLRYDVLYKPRYYISKLIDKIRNSNDVEVWPNDPDSLIAPAQNHALIDNSDGHFTTFPRVINDLFMLCTGTAADRYCYESIEYMDSVTSIYGNTNMPIYEGYIDLMTYHNFFERIGGKIAVNMIRAPGVSDRHNEDSGEVHDLEKRLINEVDNELFMTVARPEDEVFNLNPFDNDDFWKINGYWNND